MENLKFLMLNLLKEPKMPAALDEISKTNASVKTAISIRIMPIKLNEALVGWKRILFLNDFVDLNFFNLSNRSKAKTTTQEKRPHVLVYFIYYLAIFNSCKTSKNVCSFIVCCFSSSIISSSISFHRIWDETP